MSTVEEAIKAGVFANPMLKLTLLQSTRLSWSDAWPLPLPCLNTDPPSPFFHYPHFHPFPRTLMNRRADRIMSDPCIRRVNHLPQIPVPVTNRSSRRAPGPLKSFCIEDILGLDSKKSDGRGFVRVECPVGLSNSDAEAKKNGRSLGGRLLTCPLLSTGRALSTSPPSTVTSITSSSCPSNAPSSLSPACGTTPRIVRPWIRDPSSPHSRGSSDDCCHDVVVDDDEEEEEIEEGDKEEINEEEEEEDEGQQCSASCLKQKNRLSHDSSPLDAIVTLTNKTLAGMHCAHSAESRRREREALLLSRQAGGGCGGGGRGPRKRRKSRTAFSNHQIHQLEKRFHRHKYLTPTDRDDLAHGLGLSNSQVITWFQNRRAKLKRDLEELKNDVTAASSHSVHRPKPGKAPDRHHHHHHHHHPASAKDLRKTGSSRTGAGGVGGGVGGRGNDTSSSSSSLSSSSTRRRTTTVVRVQVNVDHHQQQQQ